MSDRMHTSQNVPKPRRAPREGTDRGGQRVRAGVRRARRPPRHTPLARLLRGRPARRSHLQLERLPYRSGVRGSARGDAPRDGRVQFVLINANNPWLSPGDSLEEMRTRAASKAYPFPYLKDPDGSVAKAYGA